MSPAEIRAIHRAQPFKPFDIHLADGRSFAVDHPELLFVPPEGRIIVLAVEDGNLELIDLLLVTSLKLRPNGRPTKRTKRGES